MLMKGTTEQRFWAKVDTSGECFEWIGGHDSDGYGVFKKRGWRHVE